MLSCSMLRARARERERERREREFSPGEELLPSIVQEVLCCTKVEPRVEFVDDEPVLCHKAQTTKKKVGFQTTG